ncbi:hypothetical protein C8Q77DRAFT_1074883 [Trametes polyzona]|nr:hypothetical protein C8Q77DRAFT_1074883 [Trametes polyzona]
MPFTLFTSSSPSDKSSGRRSLRSGKSKLDKKSVSRPRPYEWPAFVPPAPQPQPRPRPNYDQAEAAYRLRMGAEFKELGCQLISLRDAKLREELVRGVDIVNLNVKSARSRRPRQQPGLK